MAKRSSKRKSLIGRLGNKIRDAAMLSRDGFATERVGREVFVFTRLYGTSNNKVTHRGVLYGEKLADLTDARFTSISDLSIRDLRMYLNIDWVPNKEASPLELLARACG